MATSHEELQNQFQTLIQGITPKDLVWDFLSQFLDQWQKKGNEYIIQLQNAYTYNTSVFKLLKFLHQERDIEKLLNMILQDAIELTHAERGLIVAHEKEVASNFANEEIVDDLQFSHSVIEEVKKSGQYICSDNARFDKRFEKCQSIQEFRIISILCVPVILANQVIGVIYLDNRLIHDCFSATSITLLQAFAEEAAVALYNAQLHEKLLMKTQSLEEEVLAKTQTLKKITRDISTEYKYQMWSKNPKMQSVLREIEKLKNITLPILIGGESGTGKEVMAKTIHMAGSYADKPFMGENFAAIPDTLFESTLFGHLKGSFTGATTNQQGLMELVQDGTLFIDEVAEISLVNQSKLLRVLQENEFRPLGATRVINFRARIITATNKNLEQLVKEGKFRDDLYYRLNAVRLNLPPLRERKDDIPDLVPFFLKKANKKQNKQVSKIEKGLMTILQKYNWPGNIRQLENAINRMVALDDHTLRQKNLPPEIFYHEGTISTDCGDLNATIQTLERNMIQKALYVTKNNVMMAAKALNIDRYTLYRKMKTYKIEIHRDMRK